MLKKFVLLLKRRTREKERLPSLPCSWCGTWLLLGDTQVVIVRHQGQKLRICRSCIETLET